MSMIEKSIAEPKYYADMEYGDIYEECVDGVFVLKRINGKKERISVDALPSDAQQLYSNAHHIWEYVR